MRAARRESLQQVQVDWDTPDGIATILVSASTIPLARGRRVTLMTFEDVSVLEAARRQSNLLAEELRVVLDHIPDAITVQSPDQRVIYANQAATRYYGIPNGRGLECFSPAAYLQRFETTDDRGRPVELERLPGRLALAGLLPEALTIRSRDLQTGEVKWAPIQATGVHDPDGGVRLAINVIEDITELKRSEESQRFLADASRRLSGSSLDYDATLTAVHELAVPGIADRCELHLADADGELPAEVQEVLRTGAAWLEPSRMIVPMTSAHVIGTLTLGVDGRVYDAQDARVAEDFALRAGAAVENARLYRAASQIARALQTSLLPPHLPHVTGAQSAAAFHPATRGLDVGGDFYDVFATGPGHWCLVIGDVCGKGAEAAAVTALVRYTLRTAAARERSPAAILRWVAEAMLSQDEAGDRYCTIACAQIDLTTRPARLTVACGGHPLPVVRRAGRDVLQPVGTYGTLLGLLADPELSDRSIDLCPGDTDRALHGRAHRSARPTRHVGHAGAVRGGAGGAARRSRGTRRQPRRERAREPGRSPRRSRGAGPQAGARRLTGRVRVARGLAVIVAVGLAAFAFLTAIPLRSPLRRRIIDCRGLLFRISDIGFSGLHPAFLPPSGDVASRAPYVGSTRLRGLDAACSSASNFPPPMTHPPKRGRRSRSSTRFSRPRCWRTCNSSSPSW